MLIYHVNCTIFALFLFLLLFLYAARAWIRTIDRTLWIILPHLKGRMTLHSHASIIFPLGLRLLVTLIKVVHTFSYRQVFQTQNFHFWMALHLHHQRHRLKKTVLSKNARVVKLLRYVIYSHPIMLAFLPFEKDCPAKSYIKEYYNLNILVKLTFKSNASFSNIDIWSFQILYQE